MTAEEEIETAHRLVDAIMSVLAMRLPNIKFTVCGELIEENTGTEHVLIFSHVTPDESLPMLRRAAELIAADTVNLGGMVQ